MADSRKQAEAAARALSEGIRRKQEQRQRTLRELAGQPERHAVVELFTQLHNDRVHEWKPKYLRDQRRFKRFWEAVLGRCTYISEVNAGVVREAGVQIGDAVTFEPEALLEPAQ